MAEYLSPGVYVEEIDAGPRPIAGVGTSTAGMVGVTARGPLTGKPKLVTSFLEYQQTFGGFLPEPPPALRDRWAGDALEGGRWWLFPLEVKAFFDNGGQRLYVKRVAGAAATAATAAVSTGRASGVVEDAPAGAESLRLEHLVGLSGVGQEISVRRGTDQAEIATATITGYDYGTGRVDLDDGLAGEVRASRGDYVQGVPFTEEPPLDFTTTSPGGWGGQVRVRLRPVVAGALTLLPDPTEGRPFATSLAAAADADSTTVEVAAVGGLDPDELPDDVWVRIGPRVFPVEVAQPSSSGRVVLTFPAGTRHAAWSQGLAVRRVRRSPSDDERRTLRVGGASRLYPGALVQLDSGESSPTRTVTGVTGSEVVLDDDAPEVLFETDRLYLIEAQVETRFDDPGATPVQETIGNLRFSGDHPSSVVRALETGSRFVRAAPRTGDAGPDGPPLARGGSWVTLTGGSDGLDGLTVADFVGEDGGSGLRTGIVALEDVDEIAICAVPGMWSGTVTSALVAHCEQLKDRFAVIDPPDGLDVEGVQTYRDAFDTKYAALYYPWLVTRDLSVDRDVEVPPSGFIAGIYARVDVERGVHKAPANAVIRGIRARDGIAQDITKRHQDVLNPRGINALRFFPGLGHRVWGARTLSSDSSWRYVNVRRLFLFLEESIDEGTQWVVFEPNSEALWALVRQTVTNFLTTVWRSGALAGTTADEAFFVACDRTTMTEDDLANGRLICVIGVAPVYPAEFVVFRIQQKTRETQLT
jgi:phage tail sheath protein FI